MTIWAYTNGFESGSLRSWGSPDAGAAVTSGAARSGDYGYNTSPSAAVENIEFTMDPAAVRKGIGRIYFRLNSTPGADYSIMSLGSTSDAWRFMIDSADNSLMAIAWVSSANVQEEHSDPLTQGVWYRLDFLTSGSSDGNEYMQWSLAADGDPAVAYTTLGPDASYPSGYTTWRLGSSSSETRDVDFDDALIIWNASSDESASLVAAYPLGDGYTRRIAPNGYGTASGDSSFAVTTGTLADSWQVLDGLPMETTADYISQTTIGTGDYLEYTFEDLASDGSEDSIQVVMPYYAQHSSGVSSNNFKVHIIDGATDNTAFSGAWLDSGGSPWAIYNNYGLNLEGTFSSGDRWAPGGDANEWTRARVNALLMRLGYSSDVIDVPRVPAVEFEVAIQSVVSEDEEPTDETGDVPRSGGGGVRTSRPPKPDLVWNIDHRHVPMDWDSATMTAPGGFDQMRGRVPIARMPDGSGQGSRIVARRPTGDILWMGSLVAPPKVSDGYALIEARGPVDAIRRRSKRLPYQVKGAQYWSDRESDPFNYSNSEKYELFSKGNSLGFKVVDDVSYTATRQAGYALFLQDWPIRRVAFTIHKTADMGNFDIYLQGTDDLGTLNDLEQWVLGSTNPDGTEVDYTLPVAYDTISLVVRSNTTHTPADNARFWLSDLRVNGKGVDDYTTTSEIIADLARRCDYDPGRIESSSLVAQPLDWSGAWDGLADYLAMLDDWTWVVEEDRATARGVRSDYFGGMRYSEWGRDGEGEWSGKIARGLDESVTMLPLYNRVTTYYESPPGLIQSLTTDAEDMTDEDYDDPLERRGVVAEYPQAVSLLNPQANSDLALAVNQTLLRRLAKQRVQGSVNVSRLSNGDPFSIRAGDTLDMTDFEVLGRKGKIPPQRIVGVTYKPDGTCTVQLGHDYHLDSFRQKHRRAPSRRDYTPTP
jgi:hypothetical protein